MKRKIIISTLFIGLFLVSIVPATSIVLPSEETNNAVIDKSLYKTEGSVDVLIRTNTHNYGPLISEIENLGGIVTRTFGYASGLAATVNSELILALETHPIVEGISKDAIRHLSSSDINPLLNTIQNVDMKTTDEAIRCDNLFTLSNENYELFTLDQASLTSEINPITYANPSTMHAQEVWNMGYVGQDSLVVVIDTGIYDEHFMLQGSVIGGIDLSPDVGTPDEGWNRPENHWHGTHCAGIIAGHGMLGTPDISADPLFQAVEEYSPGTVYTDPSIPGYYLLDLLGMAPLAQLYGIKVFPASGAGVPESIIIEGIEHAIEMKESGAYDVDVISMSLGGGTGFDGRSLEDQVVDYATSIGISVVVAAGNEGPASMTVGSPGTANTAITVGAAANPVNTRVFWDYLYGAPGIGYSLYTSEESQMIYFSSRGRTSDGRLKPTLSATGVYVLSSFTPDGVGFASGTSMACPAVAGAVAVLNTWGEANGASPYDYKQALVKGAKKLEGYDVYDQGAGYLNTLDSFTALTEDPCLGSQQRPISKWYRHRPVAPKGIKAATCYGKSYTYEVDLQPGMAEHFYFKTGKSTDYIKIEITDVELGANLLGLDSFEFSVQSGVRTTMDYYIESANVFGDASFEIRDFNTSWTEDNVSGVFAQDELLQPGYTRVILENDWTSSDSISGKIKITVGKSKHWCRSKSYFHETFGYLDEFYYDFFKQDDIVTIPVGFGNEGVLLKLQWYRDWTKYPTSDLDMIVEWSDGINWFMDGNGASPRSPEAVLLLSPDIQEIQVTISAYSIYTGDEPWFLSVYYL